MTVHFGLIGCGYMSRKHLQALAECDDAKLSAVSDLQEERMKEAEEYYASLAGEESRMTRFNFRI